MRSLAVALLVAASATFVSGCAVAPPTPQQIEQASYGEMTAERANEIIIKRLQTTLYDPYTAQLEVFPSTLKKHWATDGKGHHHYGWIIQYRLNAKNQYGGYVGYKNYYAFIEFGYLLQVYEQFPSGVGYFPDFREVTTIK